MIYYSYLLLAIALETSSYCGEFNYSIIGPSTPVTKLDRCTLESLSLSVSVFGFRKKISSELLSLLKANDMVMHGSEPECHATKLG